MSLSRRACCLLMLVGGLLTGSGAAAAQPRCSEARLSEAVRLGVEPRADNALIVDATVELSQAASVWLEYGNPAVGWLRTPPSAVATIHRLPIVRLRPETTYQVRALTLDRAGCAAAAAEAEIRTGRLPTPLDRLVSEVTGRPSFPLALGDLRQPPGNDLWLAAFDADGQIVWYYPVPGDIPTPHWQVFVTVMRRSNGNFLYLPRSFGVAEITPDGREVRRLGLQRTATEGIHHDAVELPDGRLMYLGEEDRAIGDRLSQPCPPFLQVPCTGPSDGQAVGGPAGLLLRGDTLRILDLETGADEQVWSAFDSLDPTVRPVQWRGEIEDGAEVWTHANSLRLGPRGNVILSLRRLDQVISLSPDLRSVEWRLGGPGSSFGFPNPGDHFYGQHDATELPNGRVLLFDNGNFRPEGEYSRGLELELDRATMTARKAWEYRPGADVYADRIGNATRLPNGNTLVNFGFRADDPAAPAVLAEAQPDGVRAWELLLRWPGARILRYRAQPLDTLAGEVTVEPTAIAGR